MKLVYRTGSQTFEAQPATLGHPSFAVGPLHSVSTDDEAESQCSPGLWSQGMGIWHGEVILNVKESLGDTSLTDTITVRFLGSSARKLHRVQVTPGTIHPNNCRC